MAKSRFRLFAGPNASGKTHVFKKFKRKKYIHMAIYVNADRFEIQLRKNRRFSFNAYRVDVDELEFKKFVASSGLFLTKLNDKSFLDQLSISKGILHLADSVEVNSYHASFIAFYLANKLLETGQDFAFETVMSDPSKVDILREAKQRGYKTYFYFIFTNSVDINLARVRLRVLEGGHDVADEKIISRLERTFNLMPKAFAIADNAYIIDNSVDARVIVKKEGQMLTSQHPFPEIIQPQLKQVLPTNLLVDKKD